VLVKENCEVACLISQFEPARFQRTQLFVALKEGEMRGPIGLSVITLYSDFNNASGIIYLTLGQRPPIKSFAIFPNEFLFFSQLLAQRIAFEAHKQRVPPGSLSHPWLLMLWEKVPGRPSSRRIAETRRHRSTLRLLLYSLSTLPHPRVARTALSSIYGLDFLPRGPHG
jgi:hypothetical protein